MITKSQLRKHVTSIQFAHDKLRILSWRSCECVPWVSRCPLCAGIDSLGETIVALESDIDKLDEAPAELRTLDDLSNTLIGLTDPNGRKYKASVNDGEVA